MLFLQMDCDFPHSNFFLLCNCYIIIIIIVVVLLLYFAII